jgi:hypothetical protein
LTLNPTIFGQLIAGGSGLLGTLVTAAITWANNRKACVRRQHLLDEEIKRLTFWDTWLRIHRSAAVGEIELSELQRRVLDEASAASAIVKEAFQRPTHKTPLTGKKPLVSSLLSALFPGFGQFYTTPTSRKVSSCWLRTLSVQGFRALCPGGMGLL